MPKIINIQKTLLISACVLSLLNNCAKEKTTVTSVTPTTPPESIDKLPPSQIPGSGEKVVTDPICTIPLALPSNQTADQNEAMLGDLIVQPSWVSDAAKIQPPDLIEPPITLCLFVDSSGVKPKGSFRLEYEDRYGRVQYTLKDHAEPDYSKQVNASTAPPAKLDTAGNVVTYVPSYFVNLADDNFELFFMPTWGFITIKGKKEADGFFHAKIHYIKFLNAPIEPYYLTYYTPEGTPNIADIAKIKNCTGDDGLSSEAKIIHPDRSTQPPVECARAHRFIRTAYRGPYDASLQIYKSHHEYTGNPFDYRVEMVRQYSDERAEALADFQTALGQKPKLLGEIKFKPEQIWSGVAP